MLRNGPEEPSVLPCGAGHRQAGQEGGLALTQVVADRLAGHGGIAEHPEQVVTELERLAERKAERRQRAGQLGQTLRPGQGRAQMQGPLHRVLGGLVLADPPGSAHRGFVPGRPQTLSGAEYVQVLADVDLHPDLVEHPAGRRRRPGEKAVAVRQRQVAEQDGHARPEPVAIPPPGAITVPPAAYCTCTVSVPWRWSDPSMTSSCRRAAACSISRAAPASITVSASGGPPAPANDQ